MKRIFLIALLFSISLFSLAQSDVASKNSKHYLVLKFEMNEHDDVNSSRSHTYIINQQRNQLEYAYQETGTLARPAKKKVMEISDLEMKMIERWIDTMKLRSAYNETYGNTKKGPVRKHSLVMTGTNNYVEGKNDKVVSDSYSVSLEKFRRKLDGLVQSMGHTSR